MSGYGSTFCRAVLRIQDVYPGSRISDPDFYPSRIPDPKTAIKKRGEKKLVVIPFFCRHTIILFWNAEAKNLGQFSKNYRTFYPRNCH
jgi:hypothetical protein